MKKAVRLDKFLADAGAGTRSEVKKFIQKGKVQVNGVPAKKSEIKVSEEDEVVLDGNRISQAPEFVYYLLHKPAGYVSAKEDKRDKKMCIRDSRCILLFSWSETTGLLWRSEA